MFYGASDAYTALAEVGAHNTRQHAVVGEFRPGRDVLVLATSGSGQGDWKWCSQCQGLFFSGGNTLGVCPAKGAHNDAGSGDYLLATSGGGRVPDARCRCSRRRCVLASVTRGRFGR
jgi:hypothetical protein